MSEAKTVVMPMSSPDGYVSRLEPFESREEHAAACEGFFREVYEVAKKYGIPDMAFVHASLVMDEDGLVKAAVRGGGIGDPFVHVDLLCEGLDDAVRAEIATDKASSKLAADVGDAIKRAGVRSLRGVRWRWLAPFEKAKVDAASSVAEWTEDKGEKVEP